jgi:hypothetical protein
VKQKFEKFVKNGWGLELWLGNDLIFRSKKSGVQGLLDFINEQGTDREGIVIFDKIVGQAVSYLAAYLKAGEVYGITGSKLAGKALDKFGIKFHFQNTVPNILNKDGTDLCPMEKRSGGKTPEEFYQSLSDKRTSI